ncbi:MAG: DUF3102 domain-containing protein [Rhizonema sp. PD37]|nr:DUF3102 domain-containing protein [Rhizonema sp. PD37]
MDSNELLSGFNEQPSTLSEQGFDYNILSPTTRIVVQQHANEIKNLMRRTTESIINIGQRLLEVKEQMEHGRFEIWLKSEFNWGLWTARKFMQVTRQFKSVNFTDLSIDTSALYLLAAPSTPEAVRQEILERAEKGEAITHSKVRAITSVYKESAKSKFSKTSTIDISNEIVEQEALTATEQTPKLQNVDVQNVAMKKNFEDKQLEEKIEAPLYFQGNNCSDNITKAADTDNYPKTQSLFGVGSLLCISDFEEQEAKWVGKVSEVKKKTASDIELVINISLNIPKFTENLTTHSSTQNAL